MAATENDPVTEHLSTSPLSLPPPSSLCSSHMASLWHLRCTKHSPTPGPLHMMLPLPEMPFLQIPTWLLCHFLQVSAQMLPSLMALHTSSFISNPTAYSIFSLIASPPLYFTSPRCCPAPLLECQFSQGLEHGAFCALLYSLAQCQACRQCSINVC